MVGQLHHPHLASLVSSGHTVSRLSVIQTVQPYVEVRGLPFSLSLIVMSSTSLRNSVGDNSKCFMANKHLTDADHVPAYPPSNPPF